MSKGLEIPASVKVSDEQWKEYIGYVEQVIQRRKQAGTLLSVFDLVSGAMVFSFMAGRQNELPAGWVFGMVRPDMLPQGVLDDAKDLERQMREIQDALREIEDLAEDVASLSDAIKQVRTKMSMAIRQADFIGKKHLKETEG